MKLQIAVLSLILVIFLISCSNNETDNNDSQPVSSSSNYTTTTRTTEDEEEEVETNESEKDEEVVEEEIDENEFNPDEDIYPDGKYVADVEYYNSETGTESFYSLTVKVRNDKVVEIEFDNGGWLDDSHFYSARLRNGKARFSDDRNRDWEVKLKRFKY